uniref:CSON005614 protein n=1 Tax=Culicoides sonorensis TaxID=179676 RepID=A0A336LV62_CULSO
MTIPILFLEVKMDSLTFNGKGIKRHYKKDSRFVCDLYTITYDNHESLEHLSILNAVNSEAYHVNNNYRDYDKKVSDISGCNVNSIENINTSENVKKRINNHEEIRRRLQMVEENGTLKSLLNKGKANNRPSLHSRLQNGKNLQICFMNENISDGESPSSDSESCPKLSERSKKMGYEIGQSNLMTEAENDFFTHQAKLQIEARMALAQAKDMAHLQMELEKQKTQCPVTQIIHTALNKALIHMPEGKRRVSRQLLTEFTVPQLRIIVNELNGNIEKLNEHLVQILMERDELHMGQDSMLVDIEDLTRYLAAKETPVSQYPAEETIAEKKFKSTATNHTKIDTNSNGTSSRFFRLSSFGKH